VNRTLNQLQKVFLLRNCSDAMFESRTRPCLQYQIKRCCGALRRQDLEAAYAALVADAERFLRASPPRCRPTWPARWPRPARRWNSNAPPPCATGSRR
jgi:excinuclease ABC subunit C